MFSLLIHVIYWTGLMGNCFYFMCCLGRNSRPWVGRDDEPYLQVLDLDLQNNREWISSQDKENLSSLEQNSFVFLTWNILADGKFYATSPKHSYCRMEYRIWDVRLTKIVSEIKHFGADAVALQEPTDAMWPSIMDALRDQYDGYFEPRETGSCSVGMLWKRDKFERLEEQVLNYKTLASNKTPDTKLWTKIYTAGNPKLGLAILLRDRQSDNLVIASNAHLYWNPRDPDRKLGELILHCEKLGELERKWRDVYEYGEEIPLIIGTDSNSLPMKMKPDRFDTNIPPKGLVSGVYQFATTGSVPKSHPHHPAVTMDDEVTPDLNLASPFKSAYQEILGHEPQWTTKADDFAGTLDYIFYRGSIRASEVVDLPYQNQTQAERSKRIPSEQFPSDHLSLAARFNWVEEKRRLRTEKEEV